MKSLEEKLFEGGMNSDDENRKLPPGDYRSMLNQRNGSSDTDNSGTPENTKGNLLAPYELPAGINTVIRSFEDKENVTVIDFIHNSLGVHVIRQYFPDEQRFEEIFRNPLLNFSLDSKITGVDLVDDMLYFNEGTNPQRKINIEKAKGNKQFIWNLYFDIPENGTVFPVGAVYEMAFRTDLLGPLTFAPIYTATTAAEGNREIGAKEFAEAFNATAGFKDAFTAVACGIYVEITSKDPQKADLTFFPFLPNPPAAIAVPQNFWQSSTNEEIITAGKAPPHCEPQVKVFADESKEVNRIIGNVFQFRAKYIFDDNEHTTLGPISKIPFDTIACAPQLTDVTQNAIEIDFTDSRLNDLISLSLIKKVVLYVREGNNGKWKMIKELEQSEFGITNQIFHFYNDGIYPVISNAEADKLFDSMPIRSGSQSVIKNRIWYGDNLEGYDPVCIDAELDVSYSEPTENKTFSVTGKIVIKNPFVLVGAFALPATEYRFNQPIYDRGNGTVWGGFAPENVQNDIGSTHGQTLPLRGFVVYLVGTDHYAISKQNNPNPVNIHNIPVVHTNHPHNIVMLTNNVYQAKTGGIGKCASKKDREKIKCAIEKKTDVFSTFEIKNVPPGKYILRVASHKTTQAELNDPSRAYQKTSTNVFDINGNESFEQLITITDQGVTIGNIGTISILDLCDPSIIAISLQGAGGRSTSTAITGYVTDKDGDTLGSPPTEVQLKSPTRIELARVEFNSGTPWYALVPGLLTGFATIPVIFSLWADAKKPHTYTDHNGYFFYARSSLSGQLFNIKVKLARSMGNDLAAALFNLDGSTFTKVKGNLTGIGVEIVIRNTSDKVSDFSRTQLNLEALDPNGVGKSNISLTITRGGSQITDSNGQASLTIYGDTIEFDKTGLRRRFNELVIYNVAEANCIFDFDPETQLLPHIPIGEFSGEFNFTETFDLDDIIVTQLISAVANALKRGGNYEFGLVYYDFINRSNTTSVAERIKLEIPFYTEKDPITGIINLKGVPTVSWEINHEPPDFATHYQWVRTKNIFTNEYLEWAVNKVTFIDDFNNTTSFSNATKIKLDITNIGTYKEKFPNSVVGIIPEPGWRVRFMYDNNGDFFSEYIDVEILTFAASEIIIYKQTNIGEIEEGVVVEIYNPKLQVEDKIFYEIGECFEISEDSFGVRRHEGPVENQDIAQGVSAKGIFQSGDAWYRRRNFPTTNGSKTLFIDDASISDFYISRDQSIGRPNAESGEVSQLRKASSFRFSNKIFPGTNINGLSSFDSLNDKDLPMENGKISNLQKSENVLLAIHSRRTTSIYIDERIITSPGGTDNIVATDDVVGATRTLKGRFGTIHPESITEHKGNVYFWDVNHGEWIRYSVNGLFPISDHQFSNYFASKARELLQLSDPSKAKVYSTYDSFFEELVVSMPGVTFLEGVFRPGQSGIDSVMFTGGTDMSTFVVGNFIEFTYFDRRLGKEVTNSFEILGVFDFYININTLEAELGDSLNEEDVMTNKFIDESKRETLVFSEKRKRWTAFYSYLPEYLGKTGVDIVSYKNGDLWRHNVNPVHNNFYGVQFSGKIKFVANGNPSKIHTYSAISIESNTGNWFVPDDGLIIPPNKQIPNGMRSRVNLARFVTKEGISYAEFLRDMNSPGFTDPEQALINGRLLRGQVMIVTIEEKSTELVVLYAANVIAIPSELSKSSS